ncbi:MAG: metallophosphoesterase [Candidatus Pararuminococcus gallinarum]|jgi:predicted MPP superfamily phosphohydrolase
MKSKLSQYISEKFFSVCLVLFLLFTTVYTAFRTENAVWQLWGLHIYGAVAVFYLLLFFLSWFFHRQRAFPPIRRFWIRLEGSLFCFLFYFVLILLICDAAAVAVFFFHKNSVVFAISWCFAIGISLGLVAYGMVHARRLKTVRYDVRLGEGKKDYRMILLSDLHIGAFVGLGYIKKVVEKVNSLSPDMVVITGDIFNNGYAEECGSPDAVGVVLGTLQTKDGVYAVLGNHDPAYSDEKMRCFFQKANIRLLYNELLPFPFFTLVGRNDLLHCKQYSEVRTPLNELLRKKPEQKPLIVLDHNPDGIDEAIENGAKLILCGHTHRGQMFPLTFLTRLAYEKNHFYGHAALGEAQTVVSAGTGYFQLPVRLGTNSEIVEINLKL